MLALIAAIISLQYGATIAKTLFATVGAEGTAALRLGIGAMILCAVTRPWRARLSRRNLPALLVYGVTLGSMNLSFYMAMRTIPLGVAVAIEFFGPLLVAVFSSRRALDFVWIGLAVIGLLLLSPSVHGHDALDPAGVSYALLAGALWALYILAGRRAGLALGSYATAIGIVIAALVVLPVGIMRSHGSLLQPGILVSAALIGLFSSAIPFYLEMEALRRMTTKAYGTLTSMEPAVGALMGLLFLHQTLETVQWAGIGVIVAASAGATATSEPPPVLPG